MQQPNKDAAGGYTPDPLAENEWVIQTFLGVVAGRLADGDRARRLTETVEAQSAALVAAHDDWLVDEKAASHLRVSAVVLATYRALDGAMSRNALLGLIREAFVEPLRATVGEATGQWLDHAPDPFQAITDISKSRERDYFGAAFAFDRPRDDGGAYYLDIRRCLWHSFFVAEGAPELTPIFCAFDENWIEAVVPGRHGVRFARATTLGTGGPLCPFHFFRASKEAPG